jgi:hypothetical protein
MGDKRNAYRVLVGKTHKERYYQCYLDLGRGQY